MVKRRVVASLIAVSCALACVLTLSACASSDEKNLVGEWQVHNTDVTVVYTGSQFKVVGNEFDYSVDPGSKTITLKSGDAEGKSTYSFSSDNQQLTLEESDGAGGTKVTVFDKVSNNGNAEPSAGGVTEDE